MQDVLSDAVVRRALRNRICTTCPVRPAGSELLPVTSERECESVCTIFGNIEELIALAKKFAGDQRASFEREIRDTICQHCKATPTAGDWCTERFTRSCPLSLRSAEVLEVIESLLPLPGAQMSKA